MCVRVRVKQKPGRFILSGGGNVFITLEVETTVLPSVAVFALGHGHSPDWVVSPTTTTTTVGTTRENHHRLTHTTTTVERER